MSIKTIQNNITDWLKTIIKSIMSITTTKKVIKKKTPIKKKKVKKVTEPKTKKTKVKKKKEE